MADRIRFITHHGKQVLLVDLSHCSAAEVEKVYRELPEFVITRPLSSVLILSDFTGASFDGEAMRVMKETAVFDKPYVKKSALVGIESLPREFYENLKSFSRREFPVFMKLWHGWRRTESAKPDVAPPLNRGFLDCTAHFLAVKSRTTALVSP